jgi:hypothetical protein
VVEPDEVHVSSSINDLRWLTLPKAFIDGKGFSTALANRGLPEPFLQLGGTIRADTQRKNLDVLGLDREPDTGGSKGAAGKSALRPLIYSLGAHTAQPNQQYKHRRQYRSGGTRYITLPQATNIINAVDFAKTIDLPLVAHLTIEWSLTDVGDDSDGKLFAKVREGLDKWLRRQRIVFAAVWSRERRAGGQAEVEIVICSFTYRPNTAPRGSFRSRRLAIAS